MRQILHCDLNNFYASVECVKNPALKDKYVAVCGDPLKRHGIVLAKNQKAKECGVKTGDVIWEAKQKCPQLICVPPHFDSYVKYSREVRDIYYKYTDHVETYGLDECWLDVTHSGIKGDGSTIADLIRTEVKAKTGLTVSVGVSFNKIFAKLGSDIKKPDAVTVISEKNFKDKIYGLPVEDLFMVGKATKRKLTAMNIFTIGQLACADLNLLKAVFGVNGEILKRYASGKDDSPVMKVNERREIKSVGQSCTPEKDIRNYRNAEVLLIALTEMVATRLRSYSLSAKTITVWLRSVFLESFVRQAPLPFTSHTSQDIYPTAFSLLENNWDPDKDPPLRSIGVSVSGLFSSVSENQASLFSLNAYKHEELEYSIDKIRTKYGYTSIQRAAAIGATDRTAFLGAEEDMMPFRNNGIKQPD